jgi:hypothetical protein
MGAAWLATRCPTRRLELRRSLAARPDCSWLRCRERRSRGDRSREHEVCGQDNRVESDEAELHGAESKAVQSVMTANDPDHRETRFGLAYTKASWHRLDQVGSGEL